MRFFLNFRLAQKVHRIFTMFILSPETTSYFPRSFFTFRKNGKSASVSNLNKITNYKERLVWCCNVISAGGSSNLTLRCHKLLRQGSWISPGLQREHQVKKKVGNLCKQCSDCGSTQSKEWYTQFWFHSATLLRVLLLSDLKIIIIMKSR